MKPHHRDRGEARHPRRGALALRPLQGEDLAEVHRHAEGQARRQAGPRHRDQPHARGRGQDHDHRGPRRRAERSIGKKAMICLREPSLGPGVRHEGRRGRRRLCAGGADGGHQPPLHRRLQRHPLANNLLAAMIDNHIHHGNELGFDVRRITWKRVLDMNDRALREITVGPRRPGQRLPARGRLRHRRRLGSDGDLLPRHQHQGPEGAPGQDRRAATRASRSRCSPSDLKAHGAMAALLQDALAPNLVQTLENNPRDHPRRPVRQHRARLQLRARDADRAEARRLRRHRGGLRRRPRRREVRRHQVPQGGPAGPSAWCSSRPSARSSTTAAST